MPYDKQTWADGDTGETPITAERLNHVEDGLVAADTATANLGARMDTAETTLDSKADASALATKADVGALAAKADASALAAKADIAYVDTADTASKARANHTGTQDAATISDLSEAVQDIVAALLKAGANIALSYDDAGNALTISASGSTVADATTGGKGVIQLAGDLAGTATAPTVPALAGKLDKINGSVTITDPTTQKIFTLTVDDDGTTPTGWPDRWEVFYQPVTGASRHTFYLNEYGEIRVSPAKADTVPFRVFTRETLQDPAHQATVNCLELMDNRTNRTVLWRVDTAGNMYAPNLPGRITAASAAPTSPASGDVWIDLSS